MQWRNLSISVVGFGCCVVALLVLGGENFPKGCVLFVCFICLSGCSAHLSLLVTDVVRSHTELGKAWLERQSKVNWF